MHPFKLLATTIRITFFTLKITEPCSNGLRSFLKSWYSILTYIYENKQ